MKLPIKFVSAEQAEQHDVLVCMDWSSPPILPDNQRGRCGVCGCVVQHRPNAPRKPMKVCVGCAPSVIRPQ
jgi:hypothetical protein